MPAEWSIEEVEATVADYFGMLKQELAGEPVNKAEHRRQLLRLLNGRPEGAVEFKHANISAILIELGYPYINGYKPRRNYQDLLREVVADRLKVDSALRAAAAAAVEAPVRMVSSRPTWEQAYVAAPSREERRNRVYERTTASKNPVRSVNYLEREARNRDLGLAGEQFALDLEHARLWNAGARRLAERIEHASKERGDALGYDITSFELDGSPRLIEVKTTRFGQMTPFFASRNEVAVSESAREQYHVYRLFRFESEPKLFVLSGSLREVVRLEPETFRASIG